MVYSTLLWAAGVLTMAVVIQVIHDSEHIAQTWQHGVEHKSVPMSGGLLGVPLNLEWVHWVYNALFLVPLAVVLVILLRNKAALAELKSRWYGRPGIAYLWAAVIIQVIHFSEHQIRMFQQWGWVGSAMKTAAQKEGCEPCPGTLATDGLLLGANGIDGVYLHLVFNTIVTILPLMTLIPLRREILAGCCNMIDWVLRRDHHHATA